MHEICVARISLWLVLSSFLLPVAYCQQVPKTMMKISTHLVEAASAGKSFASEPKTLWRAGTRYARIAEVPDPQNHIHGLMIISEPDAWMVNLFDKSGRHMVDSGPTFDVHVPIFEMPDEAKTKLDELEFGSELEFFTKNEAKPSAGEPISGRATQRYDAVVSGQRVSLWVDAKSKKPVRVSLVRGGENQTIEYLSYEDDLPFDASLFRPPAGVAIQESK